MEITQLRHLVEVDNAHSISKAADNLFMGQPNLSKSIRTIENELGVMIFERSSAGVKTTEKGSVIVAKARQILFDMDNLRNCFATESNKPLEICLSSPRSFFMIYCLKEFFNSFNGQYSLKLKSANAFEAAKNIQNGVCELSAVRYNLNEEKKYLAYFKKLGLSLTPIRQFSPMALVSKEGSLSSFKVLEQKDLENSALIIGGEYFPEDNLDNPLGDNTFISSRRISFENYGGALYTLKNLNNSFALSGPLPKRFLDEEELMLIPISFETEDFVDAWIWRENKHISRLERVFLNLVKESASSI